MSWKTFVEFIRPSPIKYSCCEFCEKVFKKPYLLAKHKCKDQMYIEEILWQGNCKQIKI